MNSCRSLQVSCRQLTAGQGRGSRAVSSGKETRQRKAGCGALSAGQQVPCLPGTRAAPMVSSQYWYCSLPSLVAKACCQGGAGAGGRCRSGVDDRSIECRKDVSVSGSHFDCSDRPPGANRFSFPHRLPPLLPPLPDRLRASGGAARCRRCRAMTAAAASVSRPLLDRILAMPASVCCMRMPLRPRGATPSGRFILPALPAGASRPTIRLLSAERN